MTSADVRCQSSTSAEQAGPLCRLVATRAELDIHLAIREAVFVREQAIFTGTDRDDHDDDPRTLHVLGFVGQEPAGTVRLYPIIGPGLWKGDRLAVLPRHRRQQLGGPLVRFAVRAAAERGGRQMQAYIQPPNVAFFQHLGWRSDGEVLQYCGRPHQRMLIDLGPWGRPG